MMRSVFRSGNPALVREAISAVEASSYAEQASRLCAPFRYGLAISESGSDALFDELSPEMVDAVMLVLGEAREAEG